MVARAATPRNVQRADTREAGVVVGLDTQPAIPVRAPRIALLMFAAVPAGSAGVAAVHLAVYVDGLHQS